MQDFLIVCVSFVNWREKLVREEYHNLIENTKLKLNRPKTAEAFTLSIQSAGKL